MDAPNKFKPVRCPRHHGERRFRRLLLKCEAKRSKLSPGLRRELSAIRKHLRIHHWWHYSRVVEAAARKLGIQCCEETQGGN